MTAAPMNETLSSAGLIDGIFRASLTSMKTETFPYKHWILNDVFPPDVPGKLRALPFEPQKTDGVSGRRELHNATRNYFDAENNARFPVCRAIADYLQDPKTIGAIQSSFGIDLDGTYLRIEYAADTDGFWLEPHTDLGVKKFTFLYYISNDPGHIDLGTDIYVSKEQHYGRAPFHENSALVFIPADNTWHGFEKRPIPGIRKSIIVNYVTEDWRAKEQLSFPQSPVKAA